MRRPEPEKMTVLRAEKELDSLNAVIINMKDGNEIEKITQTKL